MPGSARRSGPSDSEVLAACIELKTANPEYGVKRVFAALLAAHPSWASLSERRVQKVMKAHGLTPVRDCGDMLVAVSGAPRSLTRCLS